MTLAHDLVLAVYCGALAAAFLARGLGWLP